MALQLTMLKSLLAFSLLLSFSTMQPAMAITKQEQSALAKTMLIGYIRPNYAQFLKAAQELETTTKTLCKTASPATLAQEKQAFAKTVLAFSRIEHIRFGAMTKKHRLERLAFWPDRKNIGLKQVKRVLKTQDTSVLSLSSLQNKSVALQGLTALEYVLYGNEQDSLAKPGITGTFRCHYAQTIAQNIVKIGQNLIKGWEDNHPHVQAFLHPSADNETYMSEREVSQTLFLSFLTGLKLVKDFKIKLPLGASLKKAKPKRAAFWRSGLALASIASTTRSVQDMFVTGGFFYLADKAEAGIAESVVFEFKTVTSILLSFHQPINVVVKDKTKREKLESILPALNNIYDNAGAAIAKATNMTLGFNALDGD